MGKYLLFMTTFYIYLVASTLLFLLPQQRRKHFLLRFIIIFLVGLFCVVYARGSITNGYLSNLVAFTLALSFMTLLSRSCFRVTWSEAIFCSVGGYNVQFIQSTLAELIQRAVPGAHPHLELIKLGSALVVLPLCYFLFCRTLKKGQNVDLQQRPLLVLLTAAVLTEIIICYNLRQAWKASCDPIFIISDCTLLIICSLCFLIIQFSLLLQKDLKHELTIVQRMWHKEQIQYHVSKETIDTINRKCHDMRHQIHTIGKSARIDPQALADMEDAIGIYDALYQTGNKALDIILAEKALLCQNSGIEVNCMADGEKLGFMSDTDIYSLFGNLLENAIRAVLELEPEQRTIVLSVKCHGALLSINSHNRYTGTIIMEDGLPVTPSTDTVNRGFGAKSIAMIVQKYGGTVSFQAKDGIFNVNILFSLDRSL